MPSCGRGAAPAAAGSPQPDQCVARLGRNGLSANRREGDGTTPTGTFRIGRTMYGNERNPGVRFAYRRLRCGDWWDEDPSSPTYDSFQHVPCGTRPPFGGASEGMWQQPLPVPLPRGDRVQHAPRRPRPRLRDLPARPDGPADDRLRQPAARRPPRCPALAPPRSRTGHRHRHQQAVALTGRVSYLPCMPDPEFVELQKRLRALWPSVTLRSIGDVERTIVVVPLDQHGRARPPRAGVPGLRGAVPLPRARPPPLPALAGDLRHVAADPAAPRRLLLRPRPRAGHAGGAEPVRRRLARRRTQPAADAEAPREARRDRADPDARRPARARVRAPVRDFAARRSSSRFASVSRSTAPTPSSTGSARKRAADASSPRRACRTRAASTWAASRTS